MHKTPLKHKHILRKRKLKSVPNDLEKIKAFLWETSKEFRDTASDRFNQSVENVKDKSEQVQGFLSERPIKSVGFSLVTGVLAGIFIGYYMNNDK
jgi:ElaB/YqjD/DUF883 family membrane-anchored ribosome-binding protein